MALLYFVIQAVKIPLIIMLTEILPSSYFQNYLFIFLPLGYIQNFLGFFKSIKYYAGSPWSAFGDINTPKVTQRRIMMKKTEKTPTKKIAQKGIYCILHLNWVIKSVSWDSVTRTTCVLRELMPGIRNNHRNRLRRSSCVLDFVMIRVR